MTAEERLAAALERGTDEALCEFLEWYYGPWPDGWPAPGPKNWIVQLMLDVTGGPLERVVTRLYAEALRQLMTLERDDAEETDWDWLMTFVVPLVADDLAREEWLSFQSKTGRGCTGSQWLTMREVVR